MVLWWIYTIHIDTQTVCSRYWRNNNSNARWWCNRRCTILTIQRSSFCLYMIWSSYVVAAVYYITVYSAMSCAHSHTNGTDRQTHMHTHIYTHTSEWKHVTTSLTLLLHVREKQQQTIHVMKCVRCGFFHFKRILSTQQQNDSNWIYVSDLGWYFERENANRKSMRHREMIKNGK